MLRARTPVRFGDYWLFDEIGHGGMATVYRGRRAERGGTELLAIKVMKPRVDRRAAFIHYFGCEAKLARQLQHHCIVETYAAGDVGGRPYLTMALLDGCDLLGLLQRAKQRKLLLSPTHACFIAARIAEGLHYAHQLSDASGNQLGIVHRDVSPSNVRILSNGEIKLLDFGIAQDRRNFNCEIGVLKGKFSYMSPEQVRGMPLDARADVFATGVILHELLTMERLFTAETEFALMEKVRNADVPPPSYFNRRISPALDAICCKALARDVAQRFQSAAELMQALDEQLVRYHFDRRELAAVQQRLFAHELAQQRIANAAARNEADAMSDEPDIFVSVG